MRFSELKIGETFRDLDTEYRPLLVKVSDEEERAALTAEPKEDNHTQRTYFPFWTMHNDNSVEKVAITPEHTSFNLLKEGDKFLLEGIIYTKKGDMAVLTKSIYLDVQKVPTRQKVQDLQFGTKFKLPGRSETFMRVHDVLQHQYLQYSILAVIIDGRDAGLYAHEVSVTNPEVDIIND